MKQLFFLLLTIYFIVLYPPANVNAQGIGINPTGAPADNSAGLDLNFNDKGLLIPRLTTLQRNAIISPAEGLQIYNTSTKCFEFFNGTFWQASICSCSTPPSTPGTISGPSSVCVGQSGVTYSVFPVPTTTSYQWTVPSGATITSGMGTNSISINVGNISGNVNVTAINNCGVSATQIFAVTVTTLPIATFSYTGSPYCNNVANPSPIFSGGGVAGTFSSASGLIFVNTSTGQIDLSASLAGTYTVTNTIAAAGGCNVVTATSSITINEVPTITCTSPATSNNAGTQTLGAIASGGTINWYSTLTGGTSLTTGTSFTTPNISTTTIYYVDATAFGCTTPARTSVAATKANAFQGGIGGTITNVGGNTIHTFTSSGTFTSNSSGNIEVLVVAGGGGGGEGHAGGGGAGGLIYNPSFPVNAQAYTVNVGAGGAAKQTGINSAGNPGSNSVFSTLIANAGGAGGLYDGVGGNGGSGGGSGGNGIAAGQGTSGQGNNGGFYAIDQGVGSGGGGAGGVGQSGNGECSINGKGGDGGQGLTFSISGSPVTYAGGGGGGGKNIIGVGGPGGGGNGGYGGTNAVAGAPNTGGGGGGGAACVSGTPRYGAAGGSGIVIISYPSYFPVTTITGIMSVCAGFTTQLSNSLSGGSWSSSNTATATVNNSGLVIGVAAGSTTITYTIPNGGCVNTFTTIVTVNPILPASVSITAVPSGAICQGTSVSFTATPVNGGSSPQYQWYNGGNAIGGATNSTYISTTLSNNDVITCVMISNATPCLTGSPATSNAITMIVNPNLPASVSITASPSGAICTGTNVNFTATPTNGGASPTYQWYQGGIAISGATNSTYSSATLANNDAITCVMNSNAAPCLTGSPATSNTITMNVNSVPSAPIAGVNIPSKTQIVWNWNAVSGATGYKWGTTNDYNFATDNGTSTTLTQTGLTCNTPNNIFVWANNSCGVSSSTSLPQTTSSCCSDGTGGVITHVNGNTIHTFTSSGTFTPNCAGNIQVLVVAGGGGGAEGHGGAGGAGGLIYNASFPITTQIYTVTVGSGGVAKQTNTNSAGNPGNNSVFSTLTAIAGGAGGAYSSTAGNGGSGGGTGGEAIAAGQGTPGQGNNGGLSPLVPNGSGSGGGGAGAIGQNADNGDCSNGGNGGNGGAGLTFNISGSPVTYAGGGGGGGRISGGTGGTGGGGTGGSSSTNAVSGTPNTGGGGGGGGACGSGSTRYGAAGGSGIVIISYPTP